MFKQFVAGIDGNQVYLISSLAIFMLFFIVVAVMLFRIRKSHVTYMSDVPLNDNVTEPFNTIEL